MLSRFLDPAQATPRERACWLVLAAVASTQLLAFYLVCDHQVRRAEARRAEWQVQQVAAGDCPQAPIALSATTCAPAGPVSR